MKKPTSKKVAFILAAIIALVLLGIFIGARIFNEDNQFAGTLGKKTYYHCYYSSGNSYASCDDNKNTFGCYVDFPLRTGNIKDGLKIDTSGIVSSSCVGYPPDNAYFSKSGEYIDSQF